MLLQKYMVYDEDGNLRLMLPGRDAAASSKPPVSSEDLTIIIDSKEPTAPEQSGMPEVPLEPEVMKVSGGLWLSDTPLTDWSAAAQRLAEETETVCLTVKDENGVVYVDSAAAVKMSRRILSLKGTTEQAVADLTGEEELKAVARIACLLDPKVPILDVRALGLRQRSGYLYYDDTGASWLDPTKETVRNYLTGLVRDCGEMGFDEILLTHLSYPDGGDLSTINYGEKPREENLADFLQAMRTALEGQNVRLALEFPAAVIRQGQDAVTGQDLQLLAPLVDCIYAETTAEEAAELAELVKAAAPDTGFVAIVTDAEGIATDYLLKEQ